MVPTGRSKFSFCWGELWGVWCVGGDYLGAVRRWGRCARREGGGREEGGLRWNRGTRMGDVKCILCFTAACYDISVLRFFGAWGGEWKSS
jgi:hypothetical protein